MEQMRIVGLLVSLIGGLGPFAYHYTRFAINVIWVLLVLVILVHLNIKVYEWGWNNAISGSGKPKPPFDNIAERVLLIVEAALILMLAFSYAFQKYKSKAGIMK
jgi:hypothetical protein